MGMIVAGALSVGVNVIVTAPRSVVVVRDLSNCYAPSPAAEPCEPVAYQVGTMNAAFSALFGLQLVAVAVWCLWELWSAVQPKPIADEFLKLLHDSFASDWRKPRTWPWTRMSWAYGLALPGATAAILIWMLFSSSLPAKAPTAHVETAQRFRLFR
jgi:hypothetical protein